MPNTKSQDSSTTLSAAEDVYSSLENLSEDRTFYGIRSRRSSARSSSQTGHKKQLDSEQFDQKTSDAGRNSSRGEKTNKQQGKQQHQEAFQSSKKKDSAIYRVRGEIEVSSKGVSSKRTVEGRIHKEKTASLEEKIGMNSNNNLGGPLGFNQNLIGNQNSIRNQNQKNDKSLNPLVQPLLASSSLSTTTLPGPPVLTGFVSKMDAPPFSNILNPGASSSSNEREIKPIEKPSALSINNNVNTVSNTNKPNNTINNATKRGVRADYILGNGTSPVPDSRPYYRGTLCGFLWRSGVWTLISAGHVILIAIATSWSTIPLCTRMFFGFSTMFQTWASDRLHNMDLLAPRYGYTPTAQMEWYFWRLDLLAIALILGSQYALWSSVLLFWGSSDPNPLWIWQTLIVIWGPLAMVGTIYYQGSDPPAVIRRISSESTIRRISSDVSQITVDHGISQITVDQGEDREDNNADSPDYNHQLSTSSHSPLHQSSSPLSKELSLSKDSKIQSLQTANSVVSVIDLVQESGAQTRIRADICGGHVGPTIGVDISATITQIRNIIFCIQFIFLFYLALYCVLNTNCGYTSGIWVLYGSGFLCYLGKAFTDQRDPKWRVFGLHEWFHVFVYLGHLTTIGLDVLSEWEVIDQCY